MKLSEQIEDWIGIIEEGLVPYGTLSGGPEDEAVHDAFGAMNGLADLARLCVEFADLVDDAMHTREFDFLDEGHALLVKLDKLKVRENGP